MNSVARNRYPIVRWREGRKYLWNPVHRKMLKNRPEERVRLRVIEFLLQAGWSPYRITTEEAVKGLEERARLRTDIICYDQTFKPKILIECKAENVTISQHTAEQIARYNRHVRAPLMLLTNGWQDYWYAIDVEESSVNALSAPPALLKIPEPSPQPDFDYWKQRGFAGGRAEPPLRRWLEYMLPRFCGASDNELKHLCFRRSPQDLNLDHYYRIASLESCKVAYSFINTPYGGSRLTGIVNREGKNQAVIDINLDLVFEKEHPNTSIFSDQGVSNSDILKVAPRAFQPEPEEHIMSYLPAMLAEACERCL